MVSQRVLEQKKPLIFLSRSFFKCGLPHAEQNVYKGLEFTYIRIRKEKIFYICTFCIFTSNISKCRRV